MAMTAAEAAAGDSAVVPATRKAVLIAPPPDRRAAYGANHPLAIPRVSLTLDLIRSYGALAEAERHCPRAATPAELEAFHTPEYVAAMRHCEAEGRVSHAHRQRHNIGNFENPFFPGFFTTPATATQASLQGAHEVLNGRIAFAPAGGMHHARADSAQGFCFFNDPVLSILHLRRAGLRVLYVDIDAHHGDGVEMAFQRDPRVCTVSLHMDTDYAYPFQGGALEDTGPLHNAVNLPLPKGTNDAEYRHAFLRLWPAVQESFAPEVVVLQAGTDALGADPLGKFRLSTQCFLEVVERIGNDAPTHPDGTPRLLVLGGGGYHPLLLARCWTGVWALLSGRELPDALPSAGTALLRAVDWDLDDDEDDNEWQFTRRLDPLTPGPVRPEVRARVDRLLTHHPTLRQSRKP